MDGLTVLIKNKITTNTYTYIYKEKSDIVYESL